MEWTDRGRRKYVTMHKWYIRRRLVKGSAWLDDHP